MVMVEAGRILFWWWLVRDRISEWWLNILPLKIYRYTNIISLWKCIRNFSTNLIKNIIKISITKSSYFSVQWWNALEWIINMNEDSSNKKELTYHRIKHSYNNQFQILWVESEWFICSEHVNRNELSCVWYTFYMLHFWCSHTYHLF